MPKEIKFLADDMVGKLAKRLRILGYDASYISGVPDSEFIKKAKEEDRILLTRDTALSETSGIRTILIKSTNIEDQLKQVVRTFKLNIDRKMMFTRCTVCNGLLEAAEKEAIKDRLPEKVYEEYSEFHECRECGRIYWKGSHIDNLMKKFEDLQA